MYDFAEEFKRVVRREADSLTAKAKKCAGAEKEQLRGSTSYFEDRNFLIDIFSERAPKGYDAAVEYMEQEYPLLWRKHREHVQQYYDFEIAEKTDSPFRGQ
jgi:hypothetical protein|tara:strand:+ start:681 stop:983 length:303 start_codon:yes stop_codon:yes gene_type:complete